MRRIYFILFLLTVSGITFGQNERKFVRNGNKLFMEAVRDTMRVDTVKYSNAETEYRKALEKRPEDLKWNYNLADALYKQQKFEDAEGKFSELAEKMEEPVDRARVNHNLGNTQLMQEKLDESIESYKKALRENPDDLETKYNLAYAQMLKKQKEQQQQQNQGGGGGNGDGNGKGDGKSGQDKNDQDKNQDQSKDKNDQNKDNQDQDKDQNQNQQNQDQNKDQQQQPQQNKISKQDAEQLLQALQNDERDIQDKVKKAKAAKAKRTRSEKEW
ncbi:tetratricopeptide repeat protein [Draconibacterium sediminis]|uniref:Uncharacterized protein n=1 Tax=Draconibacterium sediminis TaxID=1544798 RepID=A0A0D8J874_9BACT|nr:tetratricopeptide repeat protein [Draconibacterium sediminis]KJF42691.1 hypothetical protein LH29_19355 [Draconibacterium sediminis]